MVQAVRTATPGGVARLVIGTHKALEQDLSETVDRLAASGVVERVVSVLRVKAKETDMAHVWRGVLREYADRLGVTDASTVVTLGEGGTPLLPAPALSRRTGTDVWVKFEGMNPTGSFKDRGMTVAVSRAIEHGAKAVICASTGNTSASAAAYAAHAGITAAVLVPEGKIAMGKLSQAVAHNGRLIQIRGNFDDCLEIARELADNYPVHLVNSVNPDRIDGQKTAAYEVVEQLGDAPDFHFIPVGNAGNYTAYTRGYREEADGGVSTRVPRMFGFQAEGSAPLVRGEVVKNPETVASAIRIGNPASWDLALEARDATDGYFGAIDDDRILAAQKLLAGRGRHLRRARVGDQRRGTPRPRRGRHRAAGCARRADGHRPRPQGPAVGAAQRRRLGRSSRPWSTRPRRRWHPFSRLAPRRRPTA